LCDFQFGDGYQGMKSSQLLPGWIFLAGRRGGRRWFSWLLSGAALLLGGCASTTPTPTSVPGAPTLGIAVQVAGGARPTPQQIAMIYQVLSHDPALANYRFVQRTADAAFVLVAVFTPDALDPNQGNIAVKEITPANQVPTDRGMRSPTEMISSAQDSQQQLEAWARSRESILPRP
jgi:hypothetical protein